MFGIYTTLVYGAIATSIAVILLRLAMKRWPVKDGEGVELRDDTFETGEFIPRKEEPGMPRYKLVSVLLVLAIGVIIAAINQRPSKRVVILTLSGFDYSFISANTENEYLKSLDKLFENFPHNKWSSSTVGINIQSETYTLKSNENLSLEKNFKNIQKEYMEMATQVENLLKAKPSVLVLNDMKSESLLTECMENRKKCFNSESRKKNKDIYSMLHLFAGISIETILYAKDASTIVFIITPQTKNKEGRITVFSNTQTQNMQSISNSKELNEFIKDYTGE